MQASSNKHALVRDGPALAPLTAWPLLAVLRVSVMALALLAFPSSRSVSLSVATIVPCLAVLPALVGQAPGAQLEEIRASVGFDAVPGASVPLDLVYRDADGRTVTLAACVAARPTVLALIDYQCPMLCGEMVDALVQSLRTVPLAPGSDYSVVLVGLDARATPEHAASARAALRERSRGRAGAAGWSFLCGDEDSVAGLAHAVGFRFLYLPESDEFAHAAGLCVLDARGVITHVFRGIDYPPRDLRLALVASSAGQVGSVTDRALLLCYAWDPSTGRYGLAVTTLLRGLGALTLVGLLGGISLALRRDRRRRTRTKFAPV